MLKKFNFISYRLQRPEQKLSQTTIQKQLTLPRCQEGTRTSVSINQVNTTDFKAGRLSTCQTFWKTITRDPYILNAVSGYKLELMSKPVQHARIQNFGDKNELQLEIQKLLAMTVIEPAMFEEGQIISPIFLREKKDGSKRMILNLKSLNQYMKYEHFKMETITQARELISKNCFLASIDLEKAYYSVNVHPDHRKYLRFTFDNKLYQYTCLPNGISTAPRLFTRLCKVLLSILREKGYLSTMYIDDSLIIANSHIECQQAIEEALTLFMKAGFSISYPKSILTPVQRLDFLGFTLDTNAMKLYLPQHKVMKVLESCQLLLENPKPTIRSVASVVGLLISVIPAVKFGKLHYRDIEKCKNQSLKNSRGNFNNTCTLDTYALTNLHYWLTIDEKNVGNNISLLTEFDDRYSFDASLTGFGMVGNNVIFGENWSSADKELTNSQINGLELLAVQKGIEHLHNTTCIKGKNLQIASDNVTAVSYINNMGGHCSTICDRIAKSIWSMCELNNIFLEAKFVPGKQNNEADYMSRLSANTEHSLNADAFGKIIRRWGFPDVDMFASKVNHKLATYVSWKHDNSAVAVDAFSLDWSKFGLKYVFSPFSQLGKVIQKTTNCIGTTLVVYPHWTAQHWFPLLQSRLMEPPLILPAQPLTVPHPMGNKLQLRCGRI